MKTVHVGNFSRRETAGGVEVLAETLAATLADRDLDVHLLVFTFRQPWHEQLSDNLRVTALHCAVKIFSMGVPTLGDLRRAWRALDEADVIQVYFPSPLGTFLGTLIGKIQSKPVVAAVMSHLAADPISKGRGLLYRWAAWVANSLALRWSLGAASIILEPSPGYLELNRHTRGFRAKTMLLPLAADTQMFHPGVRPGHIRSKYGIQGRVVLFVGSLDRTHFGKGLPVLMRAVDLLSNEEKRRDLWLVVAADGELEPYFKQLVSRLGIDDRTIYAKGVPRDELPLYFRDSDVFVLPSVWLEAFGLVLAEAMACGTPVVGSRIGGIPFVVGEAGLLVDPGDHRELAKAIARILDDPELAEGLSAQGRARVLAEFTWDRTASRVIDAYTRVLAGS